MNRLRAENLWPIIKAYAAGAEVQIQCPETDDWLDVPNPTFAPESRWRVKPENEAFENWWAANHSGWPKTEKDIAAAAWVASQKHKPEQKPK